MKAELLHHFDPSARQNPNTVEFLEICSSHKLRRGQLHALATIIYWKIFKSSYCT